MPIPFILGGLAAVAGVVGIANGSDAISNNKKAQKLIDDAESNYDRSKRKLESQREETSVALDNLGKAKLDAWANDIGTFLEVFKKFKKVELQTDIELDKELKIRIDDPKSFKNMEVASLKAAEIVQAGVSSLGAGALAGIASYGGAMMFASASTGTAIATLSGAAATNATLAWFGGGSLAAGGLGMAGGTAILGGIVAGPILAVAGSIMAAKAEENLAKAKRTYSEAMLACEKMDTITDLLKKVSEISDDYCDFIFEISERYQPLLEGLSDIYERAYDIQKHYFGNKIRKLLGIQIKIDYRKLNIQEQRELHLTWQLTQILYAVLTAPILTKDGNLDANTCSTLSQAKNTLSLVQPLSIEGE